MIALLLATVLADPTPLLGMDGLWRSEDNDAVYLVHMDKSGGGGGFGGVGGKADATLTPRLEYFADDMYGRASSFKLPPDGIALGEWCQNTTLNTAFEKASAGPLSAGDSGWLGYIKIAPGPVASNGSPAYYIFSRFDSRGNPNKTQRVYWLGAESQVKFATEYADDACNIKISFGASDIGGITWPVKGVISYVGHSNDIVGTFSLTRASFNIVQHDTGSVMGKGHFAWMPTASQVSDFADGTWGPTKRLALEFTWSGVTGATGDKRMLKLSQ